jgi:hypothetical protein
MNVFISHSSKDAKIAEGLAQALRGHDMNPVLNFVPQANGQGLQAALERATPTADAFVFVLGTGESADRKRQIEWRYAHRKQWDADGSIPMVPILLGSDERPPFLRDRHAVRIPAGEVDYGDITDRIAQMIRSPGATVDWTRRAAASVELKERLGEIERFAASLDASADISDSQEAVSR